MFIVTGPKFSPASYDAVRTAIGRYYSSDCFMSQQNNLDVKVDQEGNATIVMRWATKEAFVHDQKIEARFADVKKASSRNLENELKIKL